MSFMSSFFKHKHLVTCPIAASPSPKDFFIGDFLRHRPFCPVWIHGSNVSKVELSQARTPLHVVRAVVIRLVHVSKTLRCVRPKLARCTQNTGIFTPKLALWSRRWCVSGSGSNSLPPCGMKDLFSTAQVRQTPWSPNVPEPPWQAIEKSLVQKRSTSHHILWFRKKLLWPLCNNGRWLHFSSNSTEPKSFFSSNRLVTWKAEEGNRFVSAKWLRFLFVQELIFGGLWWLNPCNGSQIDVTKKKRHSHFEKSHSFKKTGVGK